MCRMKAVERTSKGLHEVSRSFRVSSAGCVPCIRMCDLLYRNTSLVLVCGEPCRADRNQNLTAQEQGRERGGGWAQWLLKKEAHYHRQTRIAKLAKAI